MSKITVKEAMDTIRDALREESGPGSYWDSWVANIAMPIYDQRQKLDLKDPKDCNRMAIILLNHFFEVKHQEPQKPSLEQLCPNAIIYRQES